jgi:hypothetical protein
LKVGFRLYREIRDFAPDDWTPGELIVALMIADDARDDTRASWIPLPLLCQRTRLKPSTVRELLGRLGARGYEFRVIHGYGKDGRPVFATRSHAVDYVVPDMLKGDAIPSPLPLKALESRTLNPVDNSPKGDAIPSPIADAKATESDLKATENSPKGDAIPSPLSLNPLSKKNSTEEPGVNTPSEEGNDACGKPKPDIAATNGHHKPSRLELEAWAATHAHSQAP